LLVVSDSITPYALLVFPIIYFPLVNPVSTGDSVVILVKNTGLK